MLPFAALMRVAAMARMMLRLMPRRRPRRPPASRHVTSWRYAKMAIQRDTLRCYATMLMLLRYAAAAARRRRRRHTAFTPRFRLSMSVHRVTRCHRIRSHH